MAGLLDPTTLDDYIQTLPQELQDHILEYTIAVQPDGLVNLNAPYKLPVGLHLNRIIRERTARDYYGTTTFFVPPNSRFARRPMRFAWHIVHDGHHHLLHKLQQQVSARGRSVPTIQRVALENLAHDALIIGRFQLAIPISALQVEVMGRGVWELEGTIGSWTVKRVA